MQDSGSYERVPSGRMPSNDSLQEPAVSSPTVEYAEPHSVSARSSSLGVWRESRLCQFLFFLADIVLAAAPLFFILLGIAAVTLHRKPTNGNRFGENVEIAMGIGPTIFPILFAAIAARSLRIIARFQAERGAKLGSLEMLMASRSVWGTLESQLMMQRFTVVGAVLIVLWALSPLGGQASLRLMTRTYENADTPLKLRYLDTGPSAGIWPNGGFGGLGTEYTQVVNLLFGASILSPGTTKLASQDTWGNIKVPRLEALDESTADDQGWIQLNTKSSNLTAVESYSALVGLPVVGIPPDANSSYNLESSYISVDCADPVKSNLTGDFWNQTVGVFWSGATSPTGVNPLNPRNNTNDSEGTLPTFFLDTNLNLYDEARLKTYLGLALNASTASDPLLNSSRHILFGSVSSEATDVTSNLWVGSVTTANCSVSSTHVESVVNCTQTLCGVIRMRRSQADKRSSLVSPFDSGTMADMMFLNMPFTGGDQYQVQSSPAEVFINDTSLAPYNAAVYADGYVDISRVSAANISARLSILLNTYFQIVTWPGAFVGDRDSDLSLYGPDTTPMNAIQTWFGANATLDNILTGIDQSTDNDDMPLTSDRIAALNNAPFIAATTNGTATSASQVFICNFAWLAILLLASIILLIIGATGTLLKRKIVAPDMLGYVASMTYDNPWLNVSERQKVQGLPLDAMARAKRLRDLRVRIGDVRAGEEVGHLAFTKDWGSGALRRRRRYE